MLVNGDKKKKEKSGQIVFICAPALNYAIYKDANALYINILVKYARALCLWEMCTIWGRDKLFWSAGEQNSLTSWKNWLKISKVLKNGEILWFNCTWFTDLKSTTNVKTKIDQITTMITVDIFKRDKNHLNDTYITVWNNFCNFVKIFPMIYDKIVVIEHVSDWNNSLYITLLDLRFYFFFIFSWKNVFQSETEHFYLQKIASANFFDLNERHF